jgi:hypothetical protein
MDFKNRRGIQDILIMEVKLMKKSTCILVIFYTISLLISVVNAADLPPEIEPIQCIARTEPIAVYSFLTEDGEIVKTDDYDLEVEANMYYELQFWNVGSKGKKTEYSKAFIYQVIHPTEVVFDNAIKEARREFEKNSIGKNHEEQVALYKAYNAFAEERYARKIPPSRLVHAELTFEGGFDGGFVGKNTDTGQEITGRIDLLPSGEMQVVFSGGFGRPMKIITIAPFGADRIDSGVRFAGLSGQVEVRPSFDEDAWDFAKMGMVLYLEDHIKTGPRSGAILSFKDLSTYVMKADTEIILATPPEKETKLQLVIGNIMVNVNKMLKDGTMEVTMNQAVSGIKGTIFVCEDDGVTSTLKVLEGSVEFIATADGKKEIVGTGEMISATAKGLGVKTSFDVKKETDKWDESQASMKKEKFSMGWIGLLSGGVLLVAIIAVVMTAKKKKAKPTHS